MRTSLILTAILTVATSAHAGFAFNDFGPNDAFDPVSGYVTAGADAGPLAIAAQFTAGESGYLSTIRLALGQVAGTNAYSVWLLTDGGDAPGATVLESFSVVNRPEYGVPYIPATLTSVLHPYLASGARYWIEINAGAADTTGTWNFNTTGASALLFQTGNGVIRYTTPAFSVEVVPEPSSLSLCGVAVAWIIARAVWRRS